MASQKCCRVGSDRHRVGDDVRRIRDQGCKLAKTRRMDKRHRRAHRVILA